MSAIDDILENIIKDTKKGNLEVIITDDKDEQEKQQEKLDKKVAILNKKSKELFNRYEAGSINDKKAKARVKKYQVQLNKLRKQAGEKIVKTNKISKAQPRPANSNSNNVRCFMRYNNQGNLYRICDDGIGKSTPKKIAQITAPISPEKFMNDLGRTYGELTEGQRREYHRLDMAGRRYEDRLVNAPVQNELDQVLAEQRRLGGLIAKENRIAEALERKELQKELNDKKQKYKTLVDKAKGSGKGVKIAGELEKKLLKEAGLTDMKKYKKAGLNTNLKRIKKVGNVDNLKQDKKETQKKIKDTKQNINKGQKQVIQVLKTNKPTTLSFD
jgi:hypothetical protein